MGRPRRFVLLQGAAVLAAAAVVVRHGRRAIQGHRVPGGILIGNAGVYDTLTQRLLGPLYRRIAADIAAAAPTAHGRWRWGAGRAACRSGWPASTAWT